MKVLCNLTTKKIEAFSRWDDIDFNHETHIEITVSEVPDMELDRLNDTNDGIRRPSPEEVLESRRAEKIIEANNKCEDELAVITSSYSEAEMKTWTIQELEASNFQHDVNNLVDPKRATPNLDLIVEYKYGLPVTDASRQLIVTRILEKAAIFHGLSSAAVGKRHKMTDAIEAATTIEELEVIVWI